jgi:hypothetical protein
LAFSEGQFLWAHGLVIIQCKTVAFQTCIPTTTV